MKATVLVVGAQEHTREMFRQVIGRLGYEVIHTGSVDEARSRISEVDAALVGITADDGSPNDFVRSLGGLPYARITEAFADSIPEDCQGSGVFERRNLKAVDIDQLLKTLLEKTLRERATILVVDAHEGIRGTFDRVITAMGHSVIHTGSIHEAKSIVSEEKVDAAIVGICTDDGFSDEFVRSLGNLPYSRITEAFAEYIPDECVGCGVYEKGNMELHDIHNMVDLLVGEAIRLQARERARDQSP